jgi:hypothetical protein
MRGALMPPGLVDDKRMSFRTASARVSAIGLDHAAKSANASEAPLETTGVHDGAD